MSGAKFLARLGIVYFMTLNPKTIVSALTIIGLVLPASAINLVTSKKNLRFNDNSSTLTFTVRPDDNITGLTGSGTLNATLKLNSKIFTSDTTTVSIPYVDGVLGTSNPITVTLLNPDVTKNSTSKFSINFASSDAKQYKLKNYKGKFNLDAEPIKISGKVTIPSGDLASFRRRAAKRLPELKARSIVPFNAENPEGVILEIYAVDPNTGGTTGEPLATAITNSDGEYSIEMPPEAEFGVTHVLMVEGDAGQTMAAPLFATEVDLSPATQAVLEVMQGATENPSNIGLDVFDLTSLSDEEAEGLDEKVDSLNPLYEETLSASVQSLKDSYANFINNMLGAAADDDLAGTSTSVGEAAEGVAGLYNVSFFNVSVSSEERLRMSVELAAARMSKPDEVGAFAVTPFPSFSTQAMLEEMRSWGGPNEGGGPEGGQGGGPNEGGGPEGGQGGGPEGDQGGGPGGDQGNTGDGSSPSPRIRPNNAEDCYDVTAFSEASHDVRGTDEQGNFYMTVNSAGVVSFAQPAEEETGGTPNGDTYTFRVQPSVMNMYPVGTGMYLSTQYMSMENINSGGISTEYDIGFASIIKKSNLSEGELDGSYGLVGLGYELGTTNYATTSFLGDLQISGSNANFTVSSDERNIVNNACGDVFTLHSVTETEAGTATLSIDDDRLDISIAGDTAGSESLFTGFARPDAKVLSLIYANDTGARGSRTDFGGQSRNVIGSAERQVILAVKKPTVAPVLNAKTYQLLGMGFSFNELGGRTITMTEVGTLSFAGTTATLAGGVQNVFTKATLDDDLLATTSPLTSSSSFTVTNEGAINLTLGTEPATGYVASDKSLIVLKTSSSSGLGIYFAILQE